MRPATGKEAFRPGWALLEIVEQIGAPRRFHVGAPAIPRVHCFDPQQKGSGPPDAPGAGLFLRSSQRWCASAFHVASCPIENRRLVSSGAMYPNGEGTRPDQSRIDRARGGRWHAIPAPNAARDKIAADRPLPDRTPGMARRPTLANLQRRPTRKDKEVSPAEKRGRRAQVPGVVMISGFGPAPSLAAGHPPAFATSRPIPAGPCDWTAAWPSSPNARILQRAEGTRRVSWPAKDKIVR